MNGGGGGIQGGTDRRARQQACPIPPPRCDWSALSCPALRSLAEISLQKTHHSHTLVAWPRRMPSLVRCFTLGASPSTLLHPQSCFILQGLRASPLQDLRVRVFPPPRGQSSSPSKTYESVLSTTSVFSTTQRFSRSKDFLQRETGHSALYQSVAQ